MLRSKYLIQDDTLSNIMNGIKEILQPSSSITLSEAITLLSASEQHLQLNMPYYVGYDDNVWPTLSAFYETYPPIPRIPGSGESESSTIIISTTIPITFFDQSQQKATELGENLKEVHLEMTSSVPTSAFRSCINLCNVFINTGSIINEYAFQDCHNLQTVTLSAATLSHRVFCKCSNLSKVNLSFNSYNSVIIGYSCFYECSNLTEVNINLRNNTFTIYESAFKSCSALQTVNINKGNFSPTIKIQSYAFDDCINLEHFDFDQIVMISAGRYAFANTKLSEINAPKLQSVTGDVFYNCTNLASVSVPKLSYISGNFIRGGVGNISKLLELSLPKLISATGIIIALAENISTVYAPLLTSGGGFKQCPKLSNIILGSNFDISSTVFTGCGISDILSFSHNTLIGSHCFSGCINISQAIFPYATSIGSGAFENCKGLEEVSFPELQILNSTTFAGCTKLKSITLPKLINFTSWSSSYSPFTNCTALEEASFPIYTGIIPQGIFQNCNNLKTLAVSSITEIGSYAFYQCFNLSQINGNISCSKVFYRTFYKCHSLNSINIQPTEIQQNAFYECYNLSTIDLTNCSIIGSEAFRYCSALTYISTSASPSVTISGVAFANCTNLREAHLYCSSLSTNIFYNNPNIEILDFPELLEISALYGFSYMIQLSFLNLPKCTSIHDGFISDYGFSTSKLKSLSLPKCTYIGSNTFNNCTALEFLNISAATLIGADAFNKCINLKTIYVNSSAVTSFKASRGVIPSVSLLTQLEKIVAGSLVNEYKNNSYWSQYADYIVSQ